MPYSPEVSYTLAAEYAQRLGADVAVTTRIDYAVSIPSKRIRRCYLRVIGAGRVAEQS